MQDREESVRLIQSSRNHHQQQQRQMPSTTQSSCRPLTIDIPMIEDAEARAIQTVPSASFEELIRCPIQHEIMSNPVMVETGDTYEYESIRQWFERSSKNPLSNERLSSKQLIPNRLAQQIIDLYCAANPDKATCRHTARDKQLDALRKAWAVPQAVPQAAPPTTTTPLPSADALRDEINPDMARRTRHLRNAQRERIVSHAASYYIGHHIAWIVLNATFAIVHASIAPFDRQHFWMTITSTVVLSALVVWHIVCMTVIFFQCGMYTMMADDDDYSNAFEWSALHKQFVRNHCTWTMYILLVLCVAESIINASIEHNYVSMSFFIANVLDMNVLVWNWRRWIR